MEAVDELEAERDQQRHAEQQVGEDRVFADRGEIGEQVAEHVGATGREHDEEDHQTEMPRAAEVD